VACFGAFLAFLDATIVNVAFPSIRESFPEASIGGLSWVLNAYNIVFAAFLVVCGRLTDLIGRKRAYAGGIALFTLASVWCAAAGSLEVLVAGRVLQALGAAMLVPASLAIVVEAFSNDKRAHAIGLWGASAAVAAGLGPPMGGALVELGGWRWAFLVNLPFGVLALVATRRTVVESRAPGRRVLPDIPGALLLAAALALLNLGVIQGNDWGWGSPRILGSFVLALVLGGLFVRSSLRHRAPVVDPALVRIASFRVASLATVLAGLGFYSYLLTNILWLQYVWGYDVLRAGLALVPGALVAAVVAARLGPLAERVGYRVLVVPGALVWAGAYLWYHQMVGTAPAFWAEWLPGQLLSGIGVGATLPLLGSAALAAVPGGRYATASALVSSARQLGGVLGVSILVLIVGNPTGPGVVDALRDGWLLSIVAFVLVAVVALPVGKVAAHPDSEDVDHGAPLLLLPEQRDLAEVHRTAASIGLDDVPFVAAMSAEARDALAAASRVVELDAGAWLMRENDPPGSAYLLRSGRLEVFQGGRLLRTLTPGAVVGELALLTGESRSAGVRARRDATLLEVPRSAFDGVLSHDSSATRAVLRQVAHQLRTAGGPSPAVRPARPDVVAVVGLHPGSGCEDVARLLEERLRTHLKVVAPGVVTSEGLARAESEGDRVVLVADGVAPGADGAWRDFCLRQSDAVVLVARAGAAVPPDQTPLTLQPDLVVLGAVPSSADRVAWVESTDAWRLTVADGDPQAAVADIADRLAGRSLGLALAGGGARAFAHIGVLRELDEAGYRVNRMSGASVGAALGTIYALSRDGAELEERAYAEFVARNPFNDWTIPTRALTRGVRVRGSVARVTGDAVLDGLPRQLTLVSTDLVSRTRQVHRRGSLLDATVASMRLPVLFAPIPTDDGRLLMDGGVLDNLPVDVLLERDEGPVVAVNISMGGGGGRSGRSGRTGRPRVPALGETLLRTMMIGAGGAVTAARHQGATVLTPATMGVGLLEFHQLDRMVQAGREAGRALLAEGGLDLGVRAEAEPEGEADVDRPVVEAGLSSLSRPR
jgi:EmrB/QacA subfamily drug resistance transporter